MTTQEIDNLYIKMMEDGDISVFEIEQLINAARQGSKMRDEIHQDMEPVIEDLQNWQMTLGPNEYTQMVIANFRAKYPKP